MKTITPLKILILLFVFCYLLFVGSCRERVVPPDDGNGEQPPIYAWENLGFENKFAVKFALEEPYLYVCAASKGLWRKDIRKKIEWEYLGLSDTTLGNYTNVGVTDVDVKGNDILVAYAPVYMQPWVSVGILRSRDAGKNWFRSDTGIPDSSWPYSVYSNVQRSPHNPSIAITFEGGAIFRSIDSGKTWYLLGGKRGLMSNKDFIKWQPNREGVIWYFGESSIFSPYLGHAGNYSLSSVGCYVNFYQLGVPIDNAVYDIGFDATDLTTVYLGMQGAVIKSTDDCCTWIVPLFTNPQGAHFKAIVGHPQIHNLVYFAGGKGLFKSSDGGKTINVIDSPNTTQIFAMIFDEYADGVIIGTQNGIFRYFKK